MAEITAALVKQLREMTDSPMMECKKALVEAEGDIDKAVDVLRTRGIAKSVKKAGRETNEGAVAAFVSEDGTLAALAEVKCETDFVSGTDKFKTLAAKVAKAAAEGDPADLEALKAVVVDGETVEADHPERHRHHGREHDPDALRPPQRCRPAPCPPTSTWAARSASWSSSPSPTPRPPGTEEFKTMAHDVAMQVAAAKPLCAVREDMPQETIDHEMAIYRQQAAESGKPEAIQEKMALGRLEKFFKESTLVDQEFVKNPDVTISAVRRRDLQEGRRHHRGEGLRPLRPRRRGLRSSRLAPRAPARFQVSALFLCAEKPFHCPAGIGTEKAGARF